MRRYCELLNLNEKITQKDFTLLGPSICSCPGPGGSSRVFLAGCCCWSCLHTHHTWIAGRCCWSCLHTHHTCSSPDFTSCQLCPSLGNCSSYNLWLVPLILRIQHLSFMIYDECPFFNYPSKGFPVRLNYFYFKTILKTFSIL